MIFDETTFPLEACKIEDVRYKVFRFQVSTDQKVFCHQDIRRRPLFDSYIFSDVGMICSEGLARRGT